MDEIKSYKMYAVKVRNAKQRNYLKVDFQSSHEAPGSSLRELADVLRIFCRTQEIVQNLNYFLLAARCRNNKPIIKQHAIS